MSEAPADEAETETESDVAATEVGAATRRRIFEEQAAAAATAEPDDTFPLRYCKKCKAAFMAAKCPGGHPNFLYSTKVPGMDVESVPAPLNVSLFSFLPLMPTVL